MPSIVVVLYQTEKNQFSKIKTDDDLKIHFPIVYKFQTPIKKATTNPVTLA